MPRPRAILFIDGENLTIRYQAMLTAGRIAKAKFHHRPNVYLWTDRILENDNFRLEKVIRTYYYTSMVGSDQDIVDVKRTLASFVFSSRGDDGGIESQVVPVVFKKPRQSQKTRNVDIQVVIDVMRFAFTDEVERVYLVSGDGDYLPLLDEVMRRGKQVEVLALSDGLNDKLSHSVDRFYDLDPVFFRP